ncbi:MAG: hypothetical protein QM522_05850 [Chitinophagaceae bacterium]|nr:hypothetical protein [Chitinophagaceae bacterium]
MQGSTVVIRTVLVELARLEAVAYRQKLNNGQSGVVILRYDTPQPGLALLNRHSGEPDIAPHTPPELFPMEAFQEALSLTSGMPYAKRGRVKLSHTDALVADAPAAASPDEADAEASPGDLDIVCSADYAAIVKAYTNRKGELSYELLNKALIQAAHGNPYVAEMQAAGASLEEIRDHVVKANFEAVTGNRSLSPDDVQRIVAMLDEVSPRSVLREFSEDLRHRFN